VDKFQFYIYDLKSQLTLINLLFITSNFLFFLLFVLYTDFKKT